MVGSSRGTSEAAHTGSAVPTTSHTSPGEYTPAPSVAAISSPQPTATTVSGDNPVASGIEEREGRGVRVVHREHPSHVPKHERAGRHEVRGVGEQLGLLIADPERLEHGVR